MSPKPGTKLGFLSLGISLTLALSWFALNQRVGIPEDRTFFVAGWLLAAVLGLTAFLRGTRWYGGIAATFAILIGIFLPFTVAISKQAAGAHAIQVGDILPQFEAVDEFGEAFSSERLQGQLVLIKFFRGHW